MYLMKPFKQQLVHRKVNNLELRYFFFSWSQNIIQTQKLDVDPPNIFIYPELSLASSAVYEWLSSLGLTDSVTLCVSNMLFYMQIMAI